VWNSIYPVVRRWRCVGRSRVRRRIRTGDRDTRTRRNSDTMLLSTYLPDGMLAPLQPETWARRPVREFSVDRPALPVSERTVAVTVMAVTTVLAVTTAAGENVRSSCPPISERLGTRDGRTHVARAAYGRAA